MLRHSNPHWKYYFIPRTLLFLILAAQKSRRWLTAFPIHAGFPGHLQRARRDHCRLSSMHQRDLVLASRRLQLCEAFLALALVAAVGLPPAHGAQPGTYALGDLLVTFPTQERSYPLIHESRAWRRGLRTHIVR